MQSKGDKVLYLFFNEPTRQWHFEEILKEAKIARSKADTWLKKFISEGLIKRVKEKGRMPYYMGEYETPRFRNRKRLYALNLMRESGLLDHVLSLSDVRAAYVFGSFARSDWHPGSDIDLFIYGKAEDFRISGFESKLHREIHVFLCQDQKELRDLGDGLLKNIISGFRIKGTLDFVSIHAKTTDSRGSIRRLLEEGQDLPSGRD